MHMVKGLTSLTKAEEAKAKAEEEEEEEEEEAADGSSRRI